MTPADGNTATIHAIAPGDDELRRRVQQLMLDEGISQNAAAKEAGISAATLSQWLSGSYAGNVGKIAGQLVAWLNRRAASRELSSVMPPMPSWIETPTARRIYQALEYAQLAGDI